MSSHLVIARKHRPRYLRDLVGQTAVVRILENSMRLKRTAHAYLLTGPRGVGKTSTARIMAMAFNASQEEGDGYDPAIGDCAEIAEGRHPDVLELDAASHSGVERIRELLREAAFSPARLRYRVYIIDEVHMLSTAAFNALLKTLEEPPLKVKFILATTESRKVPITIKSRCQRLQMRLIPADLIAETLLRISQIDNFRLDPAAALTIAEGAGGSMRDAQTALEQIVSFTEGKVTEKEVADLWGGLSHVEITTLAEIILKGQPEAAWAFLEALASRGKDYGMVAIALLHLLRRVQREIYSKEVSSTGLKDIAPPRRLLPMVASLECLQGQLEGGLDPASLFAQWVLETCEMMRRPDLLEFWEGLDPAEQAALQAMMERPRRP